MKSNSHKSILFIALDFSNQSDIYNMAKFISEKCKRDNYGFKINIDSLLNLNPDSINPYDFVTKMLKLNKPLFVDLKLANGLRTLENIIYPLAELGVDIINVSSTVDSKFISKISNYLCSHNFKTKLFMLTVLTHYDSLYTQDLYSKNLEDTVCMFLQKAIDSNVSGVVIPPTMLHLISYLPHGVNNNPFENLLTICPGIRIDLHSDQNYQKQIATPKQAITNGANYIVVGSPITKSNDIIHSLTLILDQIEI